MRKERITTEISKIRREVICFVWKNYKNRYMMSQLAQVFNMDLGNFYRIIAQKSDYPIKKKPTKKQIDNLVKLIRNE